MDKLLFITLFVVVTFASKSEIISKPNCPTNCGNITIPFPFGTSKNCSLNNFFLFTCDQTTSPPTLFFKRKNFYKDWQVPVLNISLHGELIISMPVVNKCNNNVNGSDITEVEYLDINLEPFQLSSTRNKFTVVGGNTAGMIVPHNSFGEYGSCVSLYNAPAVKNGSCFGIGCCEIPLPRNLSQSSFFSFHNSFNKSTIGEIINPYPCSYAFIVEDGKYQFSATHTTILNLNENTTFPVVMDWTVGNHSVYKSDHSVCYQAGNGYLCKCSTGFLGNPYLSGGCQDINECEELNNCAAKTKCINVLGSYHCSCPYGYEGDGKTNGTGCKFATSRIIIYALSASVGILTLFGGTLSYLYRRLKIKRKQKNFQQNGGLLLQQHIAAKNNGSSEMAKIFTLGELEEATRNFDACMIIGEGGQGTIYKGILDHRVVAVKRYTIKDPDQVDDFINEIITLARINHRNVVKLLGCCLETKIPLLVYEFIPNGTVSEHLHSHGQSLSWTTRLQIATEAAGAFAYLHSACSPPIIHRDIKCTNLLLDYNLSVKVSDFGLSTTMPLDQTQVTTLVRGTRGYVDPIYRDTHQLTKKSDVYSFGIVLAELLTGKKAVCINTGGSPQLLGEYFYSSINKDKLASMVDIRLRHEANDEQLMEVANIVTHCLKKPEERPTMKEVAFKLDEMTLLEKYQWETVNLSPEDATIRCGSNISVRSSCCLSGGR